MRFQVENLGFIDKGEIELNNITVICGENNVGKTYLSYSIYGFLRSFFSLIDFDVENKYTEQLYQNSFCSIDISEYKLDDVLSNLSKKYSNQLSSIFGASQGFFSHSNFKFILENNKLNEKFDFQIGSNNQSMFSFFKKENSSILEISFSIGKNSTFTTKHLIKSSINIGLSKFFINRNLANIWSEFIITSERTGASLFYKELDINKNNIVEEISKNNINTSKIISNMLSRYPTPIKDNIDCIRDFDLISKNKSFIVDNKLIFKNWEKLLGGKFESLNNEIYFFPQKEAKRDKVNPIPIYMTSSSSKSLLLLDLYIKSIAQPNQLLIIDEPELNLHPSKQIYMAMLLAQLSNMGIKILITTHSDFIVKEFNNLIMLSNEFKNKEKIMKKYKYDKSEVLKPENLSFYVASKDHTIKKLEVTNKGVDLDTFDEVIMSINDRSDEIYYSLEED